MKDRSLFSITLMLALAAAARADTSPISLTLHTRDPKTSELKVSPVKLDPRKVGIVIVDPWNCHWCMTWTEQAGGMSPRMNKALECARKLGMPVFWGPTDTASMFCGWPQRQRAMAVPYVPVPKLRSVECRWTVGTGACLCGPGIACLVNYGFDGMDGRMAIAKDDWIVSGTQELYSLCKSQGLTHLIYFGGATNMCLTGKDVGLGPMHSAGIDCFFARDLAFAWTHYHPASGHTPTVGNAIAADDVERAGIPTVFFVDEMRRAGLWDDAWITEPVRITPAGKPARPYFFEQSVKVSLEVPFVEGAELRYTLDGSEPTFASAKYQGPVSIGETTTLRAAAFRGGRKVAIDSDGYFMRLPAMPLKPEVELGQLKPVTDLYAQLSPAAAACLWHPVPNQSYEGKPLRIRAARYAKGFGMRAPGYLRYELKPEHGRFVALAGVDDNMLDRELGRGIAMYPSVVFKVFLDGKLAAESPVMRISQAPWRFDVPVPPGSRQIVLVCDDTGVHSPYNLGNLVEAGFVLRQDFSPSPLRRPTRGRQPEP